MAACGPKDTNKPALIGPEQTELDQIIAEPYNADQMPDEDSAE